MIKRGYGITFDGLHSWRDMQLALEERQEIGSPAPDLNLVEIPGRNGPLDFSEALTGRVNYKTRRLTFSFVMREAPRLWAWRYSEILNALHGQRMRIVCDDDRSYYYEGRVQVDPIKSSRYLGKITVTADVDPYKYELFSSVEPWLWDPFKFRTGVIRNYGRLTSDGALDTENSISVNGTTSLYVIGSPMPAAPVFYAVSSDGDGITLICNGGQRYPLFFTDGTHTVESHNVIEGAQSGPVIVSGGNVVFDWHTGGISYPDLELPDGKLWMNFQGHGAVAIEYRGGRL